MKFFKDAGIWILLVVIVIAGIFLLNNNPKVANITYDELWTQINNKNISTLTIDENTGLVDADFKNAVNGNSSAEITIPVGASFKDPITKIIQADPSQFVFKIKNDPAPWWQALLPYLLFGLLMFGVIFFFMKQTQNSNSKAMSFGRSKARMQNAGEQKVTFADVAGADEEKEELMEIVEFLKDPARFEAFGARIPKGVLLVGPPGTGKTLLAKAMSGEAGVPFFSISGSDFVEMFVGVGASRVRDLFDQAKKNSPCIIFIDEIDAVGRHRGAGLGGGHDEREQTLNQLLVEMDGFGINQGIIIIAATNRPDILDPALLRPGRFDRQVVIGLPDIKGREAVLVVHSKKKPLGEDVSLAEIAKTTSGFTPADLENLLNEAALLAARRKKEKIGHDEIKEATFKVIMGPEKKSRVITDQEKKLTAYHEVGHAIIVKLVSDSHTVDRISIIPSGRAGGYTSFKPDEDIMYRTKQQLIQAIEISLGGRAAEDLVLNEISTGASSDLQNANRVAREMIMKYGMSENLTNLVFQNQSDEVFLGRDIGHTKDYSENVANQIDVEVKSLIDKAYAHVMELLKVNIDKLHYIANLILEKEKIEGDEFERLFNSTDDSEPGQEIELNIPRGEPKLGEPEFAQ